MNGNPETLEDFQQRSSKDGRAYEVIIKEHLQKQGVTLKNTKTEVTKLAGVEVDFVYEDTGGKTVYVECKGGRAARPGAARTDNVKKAVANGALIKSIDKKALYIIYFSAPPVKDLSSHKMLETAEEAEFVDEIHFIDYNGQKIDTPGIHL